MSKYFLWPVYGDVYKIKKKNSIVVTYEHCCSYVRLTRLAIIFIERSYLLQLSLLCNWNDAF